MDAKTSYWSDLEQVQSASRRKKRRHRIVTCLAAVVVFCTTYALILPAITLEHSCGLEEHTHTDECYTQCPAREERTLVCDGSSLAIHAHTADCYDETGALICGCADFVLHTHDGSCYDEDGALVCALPEITAHTHTDDCYALPEVHAHTADCYLRERGALVCTLAEDETHTHGDDCYEWTETLLCTLPTEPDETAGAALICGREELRAHEHDEACYDGSGALICGQLALRTHRHTEDCFVTVETVSDSDLTCTNTDETHEHTARCYGTWELTCGLTAHVHTADCTVQPPEEDASDEDTSDGEMPDEDAAEDGEDETPDGDSPDEDTAEGEMPDGDTADGDAAEEGALSEEEQAQVDDLTARIDALPTNDEIDEKLAEFELAGASGALEDWYAQLLEEISALRAEYDTLSEAQQAAVPNAEKLLGLSALCEAETLTEDFTFTTPTVVKSANTRDFIDLNLYDYSGRINNNYYSKDNKYPGFQWNGGAYMYTNNYDRHSVDYIDFGNSNITDRSYGSSSTTITNGKSANAVIAGVLYTYEAAKKTGAINWLWRNGTDDATITNRPVGMSTMGSSALSLTLGSDGYPALSDNTSLSYLFKDDGSGHDPNTWVVSKQNTESIDGLFQYDEETGAYYYNSRENHAQYSDNKFTLYDQIITPNFIVYPFGNFLPFNTITDSSKATQVSSINGDSGSTVSDYVQKIQDDMSGSLSGSPTKTQLDAMLEKYQDSIKNAGITTAKEAITDYLNGGPTSDTSLITDSLLNKMYNIDWDEETNFFFGMDMSMSFMQPKGGMTGKDTDGDGKSNYPMEFYFTGDDDVWVYIDGVLFLDLTGIHRHVGGKIDFVNGVVEYYELQPADNGDVSGKPYATYTFAELLTTAGQSTDCLNEKGTFKDYSIHSFKFYYMERGSGSSVCRMNFNFPLLKKNTITVTKELSSDVSVLGDPDFKFQVLKENKTDLFIGANVSYDILDASGNSIGTGITDDNGVFTLKAGQTAVFSDIEENAGKYFVRELLDESAFEQYGSITVNGSTATTNNNVTVGKSTFTGLDSPVQDMSNGSTAFCFDNHVTTAKLGSLSIQKTLTEYPKARDAQKFDFEVMLNGEPLPVGTTYTVNGVEKTVTTAGIITLSPGETATIANILAGTQFTVQETADSAAGYVPTYRVDGEETSEPASGTVGVEAAVEITVNNAEKGASVEIPVTKTLLTPDGKEHTYSFTLTQVTDSSGQPTVENGLSKTLDITVTTEAVTGKFLIDYPMSQLESQLDELPQTFYYRVAENPNKGDTGTIYDESTYVVEVTVCKGDDGDYHAAITSIWKGGTLITTATAVGDVAFTNQIHRYELPQTGGAGTAGFTAAGLTLCAAAVAGLLCKRRKGARARP